MKAVLVFVAAVLVYVTYAAVEVKCPSEPDPGLEFALIPHPCNCSSYFVCYESFPTVMPCYPGLHWNNQKKICDWPGKANCKTDPKCDKPATLKI